MTVGKKLQECDGCENDAPPLSEDVNERLAKLAWALAHPTRVQIVRFLIARKACVCGEIVDSLPFAQSTISQHVKILKESGLVRGTVDGPKICYCIDDNRLAELKNLVSDL